MTTQRKMCRDCPFRPGSKFFHRRDAWLAEIVKDGEWTHGCHMIPDSETTNHTLAEVCIGTLDLIEGRTPDLEPTEPNPSSYDTVRHRELTRT
jgi:transposase